MITSLEIDDALAAQLESAAKARGITTRDFIRGALTQAVSAPLRKLTPTRFGQPVHDFGTHVESPWTILVDTEVEEYFRKYSRK
jgi:hypothetical protein